jgi:hypothetical protein
LVADVARIHTAARPAGFPAGHTCVHRCMYAYVGATAYARMQMIKWIRLAKSPEVMQCVGLCCCCRTGIVRTASANNSEIRILLDLEDFFIFACSVFWTYNSTSSF